MACLSFGDHGDEVHRVVTTRAGQPKVPIGLIACPAGFTPLRGFHPAGPAAGEAVGSEMRTLGRRAAQGTRWWCAGGWTDRSLWRS